MKKIITATLVSVSLLVALVALPATASAVDVFQACSQVSGASSTQVCKAEGAGTNTDPVVEVLKVVLNILSIVVGIGSVAMVIAGGLKFILSSGDPSSIKSARDTILYALIGAVVVVFAQAIVAFVLDKIQ